MDINIVKKILHYLEPWEVISFLLTCKTYSSLFNDSLLFKSLLNCHYNKLHDFICEIDPPKFTLSNTTIPNNRNKFRAFYIHETRERGHKYVLLHNNLNIFNVKKDSYNNLINLKYKYGNYIALYDPMAFNHCHIRFNYKKIKPLTNTDDVQLVVIATDNFCVKVVDNIDYVLAEIFDRKFFNKLYEQFLQILMALCKINYRDTSENNRSFLEQLEIIYQYSSTIADEEQYLVNTKMHDFGIPLPYTKENIIKYIKENKFFSTYDMVTKYKNLVPKDSKKHDIINIQIIDVKVV